MLNHEMRCKYVETVGPTLQQLLFKKDPWKTVCGRQECLLCEYKPGDCTKKSVVYLIKCQVCQEQGESASYYGESSRTGYERYQEHLELMEAGSLESPMVEHHQEMHPEKQIKVSMQIVSHQPKPLHRKTLEGILIGEHKGGTLMNRKGEWGQNLPPRFGVLGRDEDDDPLERNRKRIQGRHEKDDDDDARPIKRKRVTPVLPVTVELSTSQKSKDDHQPRVDVNHGSLFKYLKPINSKTQRGKQCSEISIQNEDQLHNQLSPLGPILRDDGRPTEREIECKVINVGAGLLKSIRDKLPDS